MFNKINQFIKKIWFIFIDEIDKFIQFLVVYFPRERVGAILRKIYWNFKLNIGKNGYIDRGSIIENHEFVEIGNNFLVGINVWISAGNSKGIWIGNDVWISKDTYVRSANHSFYRIDIPMREQGHTCISLPFNKQEYSVIIEDGCWIASNCTILSGTHLGKGTIVSSGSVVSGVVPPYSIIMGNPARVIKKRKID